MLKGKCVSRQSAELRREFAAHLARPIIREHLRKLPGVPWRIRSPFPTNATRLCRLYPNSLLKNATHHSDRCPLPEVRFSIVRYTSDDSLLFLTFSRKEIDRSKSERSEIVLRFRNADRNEILNKLLIPPLMLEQKRRQ